MSCFPIEFHAIYNWDRRSAGSPYFLLILQITTSLYIAVNILFVCDTGGVPPGLEYATRLDTMLVKKQAEITEGEYLSID